MNFTYFGWFYIKEIFSILVFKKYVWNWRKLISIEEHKAYKKLPIYIIKEVDKC